MVEEAGTERITGRLGECDRGLQAKPVRLEILDLNRTPLTQAWVGFGGKLRHAREEQNPADTTKICKIDFRS